MAGVVLFKSSTITEYASMDTKTNKRPMMPIAYILTLIDS
jgi:hypothetical protein